MTTTVPQKLNYMAQFVHDYLDVVYEKEMTNQTAVADLQVGVSVLAEKVPATYLLGLEQKLARIRAVLVQMVQIPTLAPGVEWEEDPDHRFKGVVKTRHAEVTNKTKRVITPFELSPATKEHPAQIDKLSEDKIIGHFEKNTWAGVISPAHKSQILERMDKLIEACKIARQKANQAKVVEGKIGKSIMDYVLGDSIITAGLGKGEEDQ
jgi:hypothetical protein